MGNPVNTFVKSIFKTFYTVCKDKPMAVWQVFLWAILRDCVCIVTK